MCTSCDFQVLRFPDNKWASDADYMFFRNYMPSRERLAAKLVLKSGSAAYSCQCSWRSVDGLELLKVGDGLTWSCAGH